MESVEPEVEPKRISLVEILAQTLLEPLVKNLVHALVGTGDSNGCFS